MGVHPDSPEAVDQANTLADDIHTTPNINANLPPSQPPIVFQTLVDELRYQGGNLRQPSVVADGLMQRDPTAFKRAGVSNFKEYINLAVNAEIVTVGMVEYSNRPPAPWISLSLAWRIPQGAVDTPTLSSDDGLRPLSSLSTSDKTDNDLSLFQGLIDELKQHSGHCLRSTVAEGLLKRDPSAYTRAGVTSFSAFISKAVSAGVVTLSSPEIDNGNPIMMIHLTPTWNGLSAVPRVPTPLPEIEPPAVTVPNSDSSTGIPDSTQFLHLIEEIQRWPTARPSRTAVAACMIDRYPLTYVEAGCANSDEYFSQAVDAGIIDLGETVSVKGLVTSWISLRQATANPWQTSALPAGSTPEAETSWKEIPPADSQPATPNINPPISVVPDSLLPLVVRLRELRNKKITRPYHWSVHIGLITENPSIYSNVGVTDLKGYAKNAEEAGIVMLGGEGQRQWIELIVD